MIRMTPRLQAALERLCERSHDAAEVPDVVAAYRAAPHRDGKWVVVQGAAFWQTVRHGVGSMYCADQRTAEAYRDYLNAADASLEAE